MQVVSKRLNLEALGAPDRDSRTLHGIVADEIGPGTRRMILLRNRTVQMQVRRAAMKCADCVMRRDTRRMR
jgi:hypothetical protein